MAFNKKQNPKYSYWLYVYIALGVISANAIDAYTNIPFFDTLFGAGVICAIGAGAGCLIYFFLHSMLSKS